MRWLRRATARAAFVLLDQLEVASPEQRVEREGRAARQLLRAGQLAEGVAAAKRALEGVDLAFPTSEAAALVRLLWHRADIGVTGVEDDVRTGKRSSAARLAASELSLADTKLHEAELCFIRDCPSEAWQLVNVRGALLNLWMNRGAFKLASART